MPLSLSFLCCEQRLANKHLPQKVALRIMKQVRESTSKALPAIGSLIAATKSDFVKEKDSESKQQRQNNGQQVQSKITGQACAEHVMYPLEERPEAQGLVQGSL